MACVEVLCRACGLVAVLLPELCARCKREVAELEEMRDEGGVHDDW